MITSGWTHTHTTKTTTITTTIGIPLILTCIYDFGRSIFEKIFYLLSTCAYNSCQTVLLGSITYGHHNAHTLNYFMPKISEILLKRGSLDVSYAVNVVKDTIIEHVHCKKLHVVW